MLMCKPWCEADDNRKRLEGYDRHTERPRQLPPLHLAGLDCLLRPPVHQREPKPTDATFVDDDGVRAVL